MPDKNSSDVFIVMFLNGNKISIPSKVFQTLEIRVEGLYLNSKTHSELYPWHIIRRVERWTIQE
jgi:hypothetical protein